MAFIESPKHTRVQHTFSAANMSNIFKLSSSAKLLLPSPNPIAILNICPSLRNKIDPPPQWFYWAAPSKNAQGTSRSISISKVSLWFLALIWCGNASNIPQVKEAISAGVQHLSMKIKLLRANQIPQMTRRGSAFSEAIGHVLRHWSHACRMLSPRQT